MGDWSKELVIKAHHHHFAVAAVGFRGVVVHVGALSVVLDPLVVSCSIGDLALEGLAQEVLDLEELCQGLVGLGSIVLGVERWHVGDDFVLDVRPLVNEVNDLLAVLVDLFDGLLGPSPSWGLVLLGLTLYGGGPVVKQSGFFNAFGAVGFIPEKGLLHLFRPVVRVGVRALGLWGPGSFPDGSG